MEQSSLGGAKPLDWIELHAEGRYEGRNTIATGVIEGITWPIGFNSPVSGFISNWTMVSPFFGWPRRAICRLDRWRSCAGS
jgi:hypothetical protein